MAKRRTDKAMGEKRTDKTMAKRRTDNTMAKRQKDRQHNGHEKKDKGQTTIYKTLHIKLKIEQHDPTKNWG
jgi:hypothetical protein